MKRREVWCAFARARTTPGRNIGCRDDARAELYEQERSSWLVELKTDESDDAAMAGGVPVGLGPQVVVEGAIGCSA